MIFPTLSRTLSLPVISQIVIFMEQHLEAHWAQAVALALGGLGHSPLMV